MDRVLESLASGRPRVSLEVVPPSRGKDPDDALACVEAALPYDPAFVSVTDHPAGRAWGERDGEPVALPLRGKPGTLGLCVAIRDASGLRVVPHLVCLGNDRFAAEDQLIDLRYAGFSDVFVVRGDERFTPFVAAPKGGMTRAVDLVRLVASLNAGNYESDGTKGSPAGFSVGVAAYPEKHPEALNLESDMEALVDKVRAGAGWIVTQMLFDPARYVDFVARARAAGITAPIVPGVKPLTRARSLASVPGTFFVDVPQALARALEEARSLAEERAVGIAHAARTVEALYEAGAPCVHFFTMGRARDVTETLAAVFGGKAGGS